MRLVWILLAAAGLLLALGLATMHRRERCRRRSREIRRAAAHARDESMPPEQAAAITCDAQVAAWHAAHGDRPAPGNPHPAHTREYVLWEASFQSALSDFSEREEAAGPPRHGTPRSGR